MRKLKFRAWDTKLNEFIETGFSIIGETTVFGVLQPYSILELNRLVIQQFTGLFDQNGVEIYEGDILTGMFADSLKTDRNYHRRNVIVKHFLEQQGFCSGFNFEPVQDSQSVFNVPPLKYEVIGNIYEHPHFLLPKETLKTE